jgi:DNA polymerase III subunit delta'
MSHAPTITGHERVLERLHQAIDRDAVHHAYLFEGPKGLGKATVATYFAMAVNCQSDKPPCGRCHSCTQIADGSHPDVIYVRPAEDRASATISVEAIREVVRKTGYHRYDAQRRVIIIDPAEAMPPPTANALLKTLEEPPEGTGFILVATHSSALLPTIVSRCQRIRFSPVDNRALGKWLSSKGVTETEPILCRAQGCPGRALDLSNGGLEARQETRSQMLAMLEADLGELYAWSKGLCDGDRQKWMPAAESYLEITEELIRDVVIRGSGSTLAPINSDIPEVITEWTRRLWPAGVEACTQVVADTRQNLRANVTGKTAMDAFITQISQQLGYRA